MIAEAIPPAEIQQCVLERIVEVEDAGARGTVIGLHDEQSTHREMLSFMRAVSGSRRKIVPRSARWSSYHNGGRFSWFSSVSPPLIEPVGFGDSLMQLESLVLENARIDHPSNLTLVGRGQGGTMAVALAALWPELFSGVIAVEASWPRTPGWELPRRDMAELPVLVVGGRADLREALIARNARLDDVPTSLPGDRLVTRCCEWMPA